MRKLITLFLFSLISACNGTKPELTPINEITGPTEAPAPETRVYTISVLATDIISAISIENNGEVISVPNDGAYVFSTKVAAGDTYNVTISSGSNCSVTNGLGTITGNVSNIRVRCAPVSTTYIQGNINASLSGNVVLRLTENGIPVEQKTILPGQTSYSFSNYVNLGQPYTVTIISQPSGVTCNLENSSGTITGTQTNVNLNCSNDTSLTYSVSGSITGLGAGSLTLLYSSSHAPQTQTLSGVSTFLKAGFIQGRRYVLEIQKTDNNRYCYFTSNKGYKLSGLSSSNITNADITCEVRTVGSCGAVSGELPHASNGVADLQCENDMLFMTAGGQGFGKYLGGGWSTAITNTNPEPPKTFDRIKGTVSAVLPDGTGGWYVGGDFQYVGEVLQKNLVHLYSDLTVDTSFAPSVNGPVKALHKKGSLLYFGGSFTQVIQGATTINTKGLAVLDLSTTPVTLGNLALSISSSDITGIDTTDSFIILQGTMISTAGGAAIYLDRIPIASTTVSSLSNTFGLTSSSYRMETWKDGTSGSWYVIHTHGTKLMRTDEVSLASTQIVASGASTNWEVADDKIYFGTSTGITLYALPGLSASAFPALVKGSFSSLSVNSTSLCVTNNGGIEINGTPNARYNLACFNKNTGTNIGNSGTRVSGGSKIVLSENDLYLYNVTSLPYSNMANSLLKLDLSTMDAATGFTAPTLTGGFTASKLILDGGYLYLIGSFSNIGSAYGDKLIRVDKTSGTYDTSFAPVNTFASYTFTDMKISSSAIYLLTSTNAVMRVDRSTYTQTLVTTPATYTIALTDNYLWRHTYEGTTRTMLIQSEADFGTTTYHATMALGNFSLTYLNELSGDRLHIPMHRYPVSSTNSYVINADGTVDASRGYLLSSGMMFSNSDLPVMLKINTNVGFYDLSLSYAPMSYSASLPMLINGSYGSLKKIGNTLYAYELTNLASTSLPVWSHQKDTTPHLFTLKLP